MADVGVWADSEGLFRRLRARLSREVFLRRAAHPSVFALNPPEVLLIAPDAKALAGAGAIRSAVALLPGGYPPLGRAVRSGEAVSYGLGRKNTLTFSSLAGDSVSLALQRDIITRSGRVVEAQEWVLPRPADGITPAEFLCYQGALLLLDQLPEAIAPERSSEISPGLTAPGD